MIEKRYLYKRHNVYWVRVRVPNNLRNIIGKTELNKNLYTTNLSEANIRKHKVVAELKQIINFAKRKLDGTLDSLSKKDQVREFQFLCLKSFLNHLKIRRCFSITLI